MNRVAFKRKPARFPLRRWNGHAHTAGWNKKLNSWMI
jgi:hypothetical protein